MGMFVNPNAAAFQCAVNSEVYIDKTGLLEYTNKVLGTNARFICNSRPRRFGKSVTVDMLTAYYSKGCDTEKMFSGLEISKCPELLVTYYYGLGVIRCMIIFKFINALSGTFYKQAATGKPYILIYFKAEICA